MVPSNEFPGNIVYYLMFLGALALFAFSAGQRVRVFLAGRPDYRFDHLPQRVLSLIPYVLGNLRVASRKRYWYSGILHSFIFWGFVVLQIRTLNFLLEGVHEDASLQSIFGDAYWYFRPVMDTFNVLVVAGVLMAAVQRIVWRPARLTFNVDAWIILGLIAWLMVTDVFTNSYLIALDRGDKDYLSFVAFPLAEMWDRAGMSESAMRTWLGFWWWQHLADFLIFLNYLPYSKHSHVLTVVFNVMFRRLAPTGRLEPIRDFEAKLERGESFGVSQVTDFSWKQMLDFYTCTECGRCEINCPAYLTGKELSPKKLQHDARSVIEQKIPDLTPAFLQGDGHHTEKTLIEAVGFNPIWDCVTCGACMYQCPVFIEHVPAIIDMRRALVMMESNMPETAAATLMQLEQRGHPWRGTTYTRTSWMEGLDIPTYDGQEYLYWVGCSGALSERNIPTTRAVARLLKAAGVDFGCLGEEESCTGDPARRLGNEYLYQMQAQQVIETLKARGVKTIITNCPHCFNTIKNEYPDFDGRFEVIHHSEFLADLVRKGRLEARFAEGQTITFHDSCYLGRHNDVYEAPRDVLKSLPGVELVEMPRSRQTSFCCGAGGAHMWVEESKGRRINHARTQEAQETGAKIVATACPFCIQMFEDGIPTVEPDETKRMKAMDIAELLEAAVLGEKETASVPASGGEGSA